MNYIRHSDGTITYYDNQGRPIRDDMPKQSPDYYIKSDGTRVNGPFDFTEPKTLTYIDPMGNIRQFQYREDAQLPLSTTHPAYEVSGISSINNKPLVYSQDYVKHSDGTVDKYPRNMQWPAVSGLGDPRRPNGVYMEPPPSSEVPVSLSPSDSDSEAKKAFLAAHSIARLKSIPYTSSDASVPSVPSNKEQDSEAKKAFLAEHSAARLKSIPYSPKVPASPALSDEDIVRGIFRNEYGTGDERKNKLLNLGLSLADIKRIQGLVNARMYAAQARPARTRAPQSRPVRQRQTYQGMPMNGKWPR